MGAGPDSPSLVTRLVGLVRQRWAVLAGLSALAIVLVAWLSAGEENESALGTIARVERRTFTSTASAIGTVKPQIGAEVRVGSRLSGRVQRLRANVGDRVAKGQVIAELETADLDAIVRQREAELQLVGTRLASLERLGPEEIARAESDTSRFEASARLAAAEWERQQSLLQQRVTTAADADVARERNQVAQAQLESARRALQLARANVEEQRKQADAERARATAALQSAQVNRSFAVITAPIAGVIASVATQEGETVAAGLNAPTFVTILDLERLQVNAYVDEVDVGKIALGQAATFTVDAFPARDFEGTITAIYPSATIQDNVVKYVVAVGIRGPYSDALRPEMTASVRIQLTVRTALAIPARAVRREGAESVVYVLHDGAAVRRIVRLGWRDGAAVEIAAGVREGERILLDYSPLSAGPSP